MTEQLPTDLQRDFRRADAVPNRHIDRTEFDVLRGRSAVTSGSQLQHATYSELQDLADMVEGWAQDPLRNAVEVARLLGIADGLRNLAEVAGPNWRPPHARNEHSNNRPRATDLTTPRRPSGLVRQTWNAHPSASLQCGCLRMRLTPGRRRLPGLGAVCHLGSAAPQGGKDR